MGATLEAFCCSNENREETQDNNHNPNGSTITTINEASKSIDYLKSVEILDQRANIDGNKISEYFVDLDLSFTIDLERK